MSQEVYIYDAIRTPRGRGKANGALHQVAPVNLAAGLLAALPQRHAFPTEAIDAVILGCVTPIADQGADIAKGATLLANWDEKVPGIHINCFCASGLEAVNIGAMRIASGWENFIVAGGVESMSRLPIGSDGGALAFDPQITIPHLIVPQGISADLIATLGNYSRKDVDRFALRSQQAAANAWKNNYFANAIVPVIDENGIILLDYDEHPHPDTSLEKLAQLKPAFSELGQLGFDVVASMRYTEVENINHVHTAGNSSGIVDGAGLVLLGSKAIGNRFGFSPRARIVATALTSADPTIMLTAPTPVTKMVLAKANLTIEQIDLFEVNEAFASVVLRYMDDLQIPLEKINVNGGAIALGHPIGATGAMLLGTCLDELERRGQRYGLITLCAAGGMGVATIIERFV
ncbi:MAG: acetyl-CoA C-acetyltransferase [Pseudomonadota bacterium]|nr:acetyl-CoA C-acetyltransferase [Pseudomonadota bacterium]